MSPKADLKFMFKILKTDRAQAITGDYLLTFFLVVGIISAMTVFVQRALQAKFRDARNFAVNAIIRNAYDGPIWFAYEPYYANVASTSGRDLSHIIRIRGAGGGVTGTFIKDIDEITAVQSQTQQLPPAEAD